MLPYLQEQFFNPSAPYRAARAVRKAIDEARESVATLVGAKPSEIVFTSGGTEATNTALSQFSRTLVAATEHPATLRTAKGDLCPVEASGCICLDQWRTLLPGHDGASFAWANHESGVIQPAAELAQLAREAGARVHADLVQAAGKLRICLHDTAIDFASLSAHKLHGPKGIGALYIRTGTECHPYLTGGAQEDYRRAGTENVPGIIGLGKAAELALAEADTYARLAGWRDLFEHRLREAGLHPVINGGASPRLPHVSNLRIPGCKAESLFLIMEPAGLICSTGSACTSAEPHPSHVLLAMGLDDAEARESLRFSMNRFTTREDVEQAASILISSVQKLRSVQSSRTGPVMVYR